MEDERTTTEYKFSVVLNLSSLYCVKSVSHYLMNCALSITYQITFFGHRQVDVLRVVSTFTINDIHFTSVTLTSLNCWSSF